RHRSFSHPDQARHEARTDLQGYRPHQRPEG
ncbi:hypothetical protein BN1723_019932, partial [Verticillium longisporum]